MLTEAADFSTFRVGRVGGGGRDDGPGGGGGELRRKARHGSMWFYVNKFHQNQPHEAQDKKGIGVT
jgi:hypothetical protein